MGVFDTIGNAAVGQGGNYLKSGHQYLVEVLRALMKRGRQGEQFFIVELLIHESDDSTNPPGFRASWTVNMKHDASLGNIKWFLGACYGIPVADKQRLDTEITSQVAEFAVSEQNPLAGRLLEVAVHEVPTRAGGKFSKHDWASTTRQPNPAARAAASAREAAVSSTPVSVPQGFAPQKAWPPAAQPAYAPPPAQAYAPPPAQPAYAPPPAQPAYAPPPTYATAAPPVQAYAPPPAQPAYAPPPVAAPPPPLPAVFPPVGWTAHPNSPGWFYRGQEVVAEAQLRSMAANGQA